MWWLVLLTLVGLLTSLLLKNAVASRGVGKLPPIRSGWLPWLGCALEFGKEPLNFIRKTKIEVTRAL